MPAAATPNARLGAALKALQRLQDKHEGVVESADLEPADRRLLAGAGFLRPVIKGWYVCSNPADAPGDSTVWFASFWAFLSGYLGKRFGKRYCLNPEASLLLHTGNTVVPPQVVAATKLGGNNILHLPHGTSLLTYQDDARVPKTRVDKRGLQAFPLAEALCRAGPHWFAANPRDAQIALADVRDTGELLAVLLEGEGLLAAVLDPLALHEAVVGDPHHATRDGRGSPHEAGLLQDEDALAGRAQHQRGAHRAAAAADDHEIESLVHLLVLRLVSPPRARES